MKSTISIALLLLLSSTLHAQARRLPASVPAATSQRRPFDALVFLDSTDSNLESHPARMAQPGGNLVSVGQLRIPAKAIKEYERAQKAFQQSNVRASADHLQKALHIYPDFIQAHNALGVRFLQLGDFQKALAECQTALSLDANNALTHQNLSFVLLLLNRNQEAEAEARQSLDLDSQLVTPRYVLGRAVIAQARATPEAIEMLRSSESTFPDASLVLAQIHFTMGRTDEVIADLRHYLRSPSDADNKQKAECWVAQLSREPTPAGCPAAATRPSFR
jgi:tetratricopeptide (TPR) repeat protein